MEKIFVTRAALNTMWEEGRECPTETGGALIGTSKIKLIALIAGDPGPNAKKSYAMFTSDPEHDESLLELARREYKRQLVVQGHWHKQPAGMVRPSGEGGQIEDQSDLGQALRLLKIMEKEGDSAPFEVCIIFQDSDKPEGSLHPYILRPGLTKFENLELNIIDDDDPLIGETLQGEAIWLVSENEGHPWNDPDFAFHLTPVGRARLERDERELKNKGWAVALREESSSKRISMKLEKDGKVLLGQFPSAYPLNPPSFYDSSDRSYLSNSSQWSSEISITYWLEQSLKQKMTVLQQPPIPPAKSQDMPKFRRVLIWAIVLSLVYYAGYITGLFLEHPTQ
jgi:hypothetical protein